MIDYQAIIGSTSNVSVFYGIGTNVWQTWTKPRNCTFLQFLVIGGGGGGGAAGSGAAITSRSGGGGGGSSAISRVFVPASYIPDTLYILVGMGGVGGLPQVNSAGISGSSGQLSYVSIQPNISSSNVLVASGNVAANGGGGGAVGSSNAIAGSAGTIFTQANGLLSHLTHPTFVAGTAGVGGGNQNQSSAGGNNFVTITSIVTGGCGGAGVNNISRSGVGVTGAGFVPTINGGNVTTLSQADSGFSSFGDRMINMRNNLMFTGGGGGYARFDAAGGDGGNGAFGSGGGGGGAGTTGGRGGNGGNGLVIITAG